jgi:pyrimidine deaminase RibD-like protein
MVIASRMIMGFIEPCCTHRRNEKCIQKIEEKKKVGKKNCRYKVQDNIKVDPTGVWGTI